MSASNSTDRPAPWPNLELRRLLYTLYFRLVFGRPGFFRAFRRIYYMFIYDRPGRFATLCAEFVSTWELKMELHDVPISKDTWESQYLGGHWAYMTQFEESPRYSVILGHLQYLRKESLILDIGCGEGILQERLRCLGYSKYVGIDVSETAIRKASSGMDQRTRFVVADAATFAPTESFDAIVFNECLYYFRDPISVFERYMNHLKKDGIIITSHAKGVRSNAIRKALRRRYRPISEVTTTTNSHTWICNVFTLQNLKGTYTT